MKHHIIFKFIAVLLCAASLLGIVGSAAGIFVLTEMDLYNKTVDQVKEARIQDDGQGFAHEAALRYASQTLGSCPEAFVESHYGTHWFHHIYEDGKYSYALLDADGNQVYSYGEPLTGGTTYTFPVSGQYLHMVSMETESEMNARTQAETASYATGMVIGETYDVTNTLPPEGKLISNAVFYDPNGLVLYEIFNPESGVGYLYYGQDGNVTFSGFDSEYQHFLDNTAITGVAFYDLLDMAVYQASSMEGVGIVTFNDQGQIVFTASVPQLTLTSSAVADTLPPSDALETTAPKVIVTEVPVEVTPAEEPPVPDTTAAEPTEETAPEEEDPEEEATEETHSSASDIPEEETVPAEETKSEESAESEETAETEQTAPTETPTEPAPTEAPTEPAPTEAPTEPAPTEAPTIPTEAAEPTEPVLINGKPLDEFQIEIEGYYDPEQGESVFVSYVYTPMPEYTVELYLAPGALRTDNTYELLRIVQSLSDYLFPALGICLLVFAVCAVYLCCAAGRKPKSEEVRAGGLNRMPLELYFGLACGGVVLIVGLVGFAAEELLNQNIMVCCLFTALAAYLCCLILVGFLYAFVSQIKTPGGYWWRNTLYARFIMLFMRFGVWLENFLSQKCLPAIGRLCKALWKLLCKTAVGLFHLWERFGTWTVGATGRVFSWMGKNLHRFFSLLPLTWQWLLVGFILLFLGFANDSISDTAGILALFLGLSIVFYASHCFGILSESAKRMSKGDLDTKVDDKLLLGCFKDFADDLNDLADVAVVAAQKQLKSERMKTELITNVSHDIKTPLTSIINYVDLLQKPHNEEQEAQYLEVLNRQSLRLKKLIDDLMEMSKASTGNMTVEVTTLDAVESVNQALGEFADKLSAAQLTPVFRHTEQSVAMMADGKLVWRVMSNLLTNAVKYAMPGTRLYVDLMELEGKVVISLKNISREELNVDADELMERFVRGDDSRNTEGSGLGLNIAKSLMELQKGQLQLLVDGDLFKVTLIFPGA